MTLFKDQPKSFVRHPRSVNEARSSVLQSEQKLSSIVKLWIMITLLPKCGIQQHESQHGFLSANAPGMRINLRLLQMKIKARMML